MKNQYKRKRKYKRKKVNWEREIAKGNVERFYKSTDWLETREKALMRDKYTCQFYIGNFEQHGKKPDRFKLVRANTVHHIKPVREYPELCLDVDNLVSLSHEAHEIIEGRTDILKEYAEKNRKKPLTEERW